MPFCGFLIFQTELSKKVAQILELISSCIDPFDLDVFTPHLVRLEEKQVQQCSVSGLSQAVHSTTLAKAAWCSTFVVFSGVAGHTDGTTRKVST